MARASLTIAWGTLKIRRSPSRAAARDDSSLVDADAADADDDDFDCFFLWRVHDRRCSEGCCLGSASIEKVGGRSAVSLTDWTCRFKHGGVA